MRAGTFISAQPDPIDLLYRVNQWISGGPIWEYPGHVSGWPIHNPKLSVTVINLSWPGIRIFPV
jgi:hypothetical protein